MLFEPFVARSLRLANRAVMAPMTRSRAVDGNTPNALMAEYYGQRASAGLIVTEGTSPSPNGLGYPRIPGLFNEVQMRGWQLVTDAVHAQGGKIVVQLMHTGRVTQIANLPPGAEVVGPAAATCPGEMFTDANGMQPHTTPRAMTEADIAHAVGEFAQAARLAMQAGFDGVELHAANGYLIEQFLTRTVAASPVATASLSKWPARRRRPSVPTRSASACPPTACSTAPGRFPRSTRSTCRWCANCRLWACCTCTNWTIRRWARRRCRPR